MNTANRTETQKIADLRADFVRDFYIGIEERWDSWSMDQLSLAIVKLTNMLPPELK